MQTTDAIDSAISIGEALIDEAEVLPDGTLTWHRGCGIDRQMVPDGGLINGRAGEGVFFAALWSTTRDETYREVARRALGGVVRRLNDPELRVELTRDLGIGGTLGVGSLAYGLVVAGRMIDDDEVLRAACNVARAISRDAVRRDDTYDIVMGAAGAILGLLAIVEEGNASEMEDDVWSRIHDCVEHLLAHRSEDPETAWRAWKTIYDTPSSGFAHGACGISYALLRVYAHTGEERLYRAALEALDFERTLYRDEAQNWPDCRTDPQDRPLWCTWCRGAASIAIGRVGVLPMLKAKEQRPVAQDLMRALTTTSQFPTSGTADHLCCGNVGRALILVEAGRRLENESLIHLGRKRALAVRQTADFCGGAYRISSRREPERRPGFFQGLAGIGYAFLQLKAPSLPSVLLLETPSSASRPAALRAGSSHVAA
jgi:lantibiotic modifying enzyme